MEKKHPTDGAVSAPVTVQPAPQAYRPILPREMHIERQGGQAVPYTIHYPQVRGGVCEFCGILDKNVPSEHQYKLCPHYRGMQLVCSYCEANKNPDDVIYHSVLNVHGHPDNPNRLVVVCDAYECTKKHETRFKTSGR